MFTQPDRPAGRGLKLTPSPVKRLAMQHGISVHQPLSLRDPDSIAPLVSAGLDLLIVAAYGLILPLAALRAARLGALNIHASLLPRWRGAAPIQRALMAGDRETGISIMQMDEGLDTGAVISRHALPILPEDDAGTLHERLADLGASAILDAIALVESGQAPAEPQPQEGVSYAHKIGKGDTELDWRRPNLELERQIRALRPSPGARTQLHGATLKVWAAHCVDQDGTAGLVLEAGDSGIVIGCGSGALCITSLQRSGGTRVGAGDFLRGTTLALGDRLDASR